MSSTRILTAGLLLFAAACASNPTDSAPLSANISLDAATLSADGTAEDVDVMTGMDGGVGYLTTSPLMQYGASIWDPRSGHPGFVGCNFANGRFGCPPENRNGLTVNRTVTLTPEGPYDSLLTTAIHIVASVAGDVSHGPWTATIARSRDFTITGLGGTETTRTVNGSGNESVSRSRMAGSSDVRTYTVVGTSTVVNVVLPVRAPGVDPWPLSGTVTRVLTMTRSSGPDAGTPVTRTVVITFNGTSTPTAMVNGELFTLDLAARSCQKGDHREHD